MSRDEAQERIWTRMCAFVGALQDEITRAIEDLDGGGRFREDLWRHVGGGGGRTRVLEGGVVFEKAAVNTSAVEGRFDESFARKLGGEGVEYSATGLSLIFHPQSPMVPAVHANVRYIVHGARSWFGGGIDLTPYYLFEDDARHFHATLKAMCDRHGPGRYARYKKACDEYFFLKNRGEARGLGGIFFDHESGELEAELAFAIDCGRAFMAAVLPIMERRKDASFTEEQRAWQETRRGRYVEFNLLYDRGTAFGFETRGRTESILVSLPPRVRWAYAHEPADGSEEAQLVAVLRAPREWA
jgi:coproporphyrinogen III oxidase